MPSQLMARAAWQTVRCPVIKGPHFLHQPIATGMPAATCISRRLATDRDRATVYAAVFLYHFVSRVAVNESTAYGVDTIM